MSGRVVHFYLYRLVYSVSNFLQQLHAHFIFISMWILSFRLLVYSEHFPSNLRTRFHRYYYPSHLIRMRIGSEGATDSSTAPTITLISSTYLLYIYRGIPNLSTLAVNSLSHHTINICAKTPVNSKPIAPPLACFLTVWRANAGIFFLVYSICMNFFSLNFPLHEFFFCTSPAPSFKLQASSCWESQILDYNKLRNSWEVSKL